MGKIMDEYWRSKQQNEPVPHILGLTASPVIGARETALKKLEERMDSICTSPKIHRETLLSHANRPTMTLEIYETSAAILFTQSVTSLQAVYRGLDIRNDPDVLGWKTEDSEKSREKLRSVLEQGKNTFIQSQMIAFCRRSENMCQQLGPLAADIYIAKVTSMFIDPGASKDSSFLTWDYSSRVYLAEALKQVVVDQNAPIKMTSPNSITTKMQCLIRILSSQNPTSRGIIFVTERSSAVIISHLLSRHAVVKERFRVGAMVGTSKRSAGRRDLGDICSSAEQSKVLQQFREGELNLLVATSVLEEGIDVSACNLVVCFDEPSSLKAFIQRRGRARKSDSKYVMLVDKKSTEELTEWEKLEKQMRDEYEREDRELQTLEAFVRAEVPSNRQFRVPKTGALLEMDNAKNHLQLFCARVASGRYANTLPYYVIQSLGPRQASPNDEPPLLKAKVVLPAFIAPDFRTTWSKETSRSEKTVTKDAAFEAYRQLYDAGFVDDNLMPLVADKTEGQDQAGADCVIDVSEQINPWAGVAKAWRGGNTVQRYSVTLKDDSESTRCVVEMMMPVHLDQMEPILCSSTEACTVVVSKTTGSRERLLDEDHTANLLSLSCGHCLEIQNRQQLVVFNIPKTNFGMGEDKKVMPHAKPVESGYDSLPRDVDGRDSLLVLRALHQQKPSAKQAKTPPDTEGESLESHPFAIVENWPSRTDFLHGKSSSNADGAGGSRSRKEPLAVFEQSHLRADGVANIYAEFGRLIPFILHKIEGQLVAQELNRTLLSYGDIGCEADINHIRSAITVPARMEAEYQRLEFVGGTCLNLLTAVYFTSKCKSPPIWAHKLKSPSNLQAFYRPKMAWTLPHGGKSEDYVEGSLVQSCAGSWLGQICPHQSFQR
jgi:hypothetical protein